MLAQMSLPTPITSLRAFRSQPNHRLPHGAAAQTSTRVLCRAHAEQRPQEQRGFNPDRRQLIAALGWLAASGGVAPSRAQEAVLEEIPLPNDFLAKEFSFAFPSSWVLAFDRSERTQYGALALAGNFREQFATFGVERERAPQGELDASSLVDALLGSKKNAASTLRFELLNSGQRTGPGGRTYYDFEYVLEICRGEIQEGLGGVLRCLGGQGQEVRTVVRRHLTTATLKGEYLYLGDAAAAEDAWPASQAQLRAVVRSFSV